MQKRYAGFLLLIAILLILRLPALIHPILDVDEAIYGLFARIWFDGGIPYVDCVETKPLGIYFLFGVIFSVFGKFNTIAVHAVTIAIVGSTAYVIGLIAQGFGSSASVARVTSHESRVTGFFAALFYIVFSTTYIPKYIATTIEPVMLLPVALQFYLWIRFEREGKSWLAFASGAAFSAACLFKYQAGINLFVMTIYLSILRPFIIRDVPYREHWRGFARFLIGAVPLPLIMLAYLWHAGALDGFILWNIYGNAEYISGGAAMIGFAKRLLTRVLPYIASTALIWVLAGIRIKTIVRSLRVPSHESRVTSPEYLIALWFLLSIIPVSTGYRFYGHYFLLLIPPMAILAAPVAANAFANAKRRWPAILIAFWIILPAAGFFAARFFMADIHHAVGEDNVDDYKPIAAYVAARTESQDRIVAWGYAPLVYWYSERMPGTRFFWSDLLTGRVTGLFGDAKDGNVQESLEAWDMFMDDIKNHQPAYIIDTTPAGLHGYKNYPVTRYPRLMEYLQKNYREETTINGAVFYRRIRS